MLIAGAKRHAKEILELFHQYNKLEGLCFFDDISDNFEKVLLGKFPVIRSLKEVQKYFTNNPEFVLGIGNPKLRKILSDKLIEQNGRLVSIIAKTAYIGNYDVQLGNGLNIMHNALISNSVKIGTGTLINAFVSVHHDVIIGEYCEVSPGAVLLGGCQIGNFVSVGSNATILPDVKIGDNAIIGAGAVVTSDIESNVVAYGVPARKILPK